MKGKNGVYSKKSIAITAILILLMIGASFFVTTQINFLEEDRSFRRLHEEAGALAQTIETHAQSDREQLELIAAVIGQYDDFSSQELWNILDSYKTVGMISGLELLLPDNTVLTKGGKRIDASGQLSFEEEAALGAHITDRERSLSSDGAYIVRHYVPVIQNGETAALLYGIINLGTLPEDLLAQPYGGQAAIYMIEGQTGDFLLDTWHDEPGNIWALGERPMAPGYDHEQLKQGLIDGQTGYVVFVSQTTGEYLYFYYEPMEINNWRIALSVPEDVVFSSANRIKGLLYLFLAFEVVCLILYFLWTFRHNRRIYRVMKALGEQDTLVGIYNRNRYESDRAEILKRCRHSLACIYLDANGLHELNNSQGHEAGDRMLQAVARQLIQKFGSQYTYRIGGDEFLAFAVDLEEDTVIQRCRALEEELAQEGYSVSIGMQWQTNVSSITSLTKAAEKKMYARKKTYYQKEQIHRGLRG